jgi:DNA-binding transcriptional MerR regulator
MRIGDLAAQTGVSVRALRYYEEQHLLSSERSAGGQRTYPESAVERVLMIQQLYAAGLASRSIEPLMPCMMSREVTPELLDRLRAERERIDARIGDLVQTRDRLDSIIAVAATAVDESRLCPRQAPSRPGSSGRHEGRPPRGSSQGGHEPSQPGDAFAEVVR